MKLTQNTGASRESRMTESTNHNFPLGGLNASSNRESIHAFLKAYRPYKHERNQVLDVSNAIIFLNNI